MKTKMKMKMVVVLSCVLCVSADFLHEDLYISGCSDSDEEDLATVDGEEKWYADFINGRGVMPQPSFVDPITCSTCYENAVAQLHICKTNLEKRRRALKNPPVQLDPPSSPTIYSRDDVELGENNILICHVTGFYPAPVNISWTKNREIVTKGSSINLPFPNKDNTFTQVSRLEFIPQLGDIYSCTVRHPSLDQPLTRFWDVEVDQPSIGPTVFCALGATVFLLGVAAGTFLHVKGKEFSRLVGADDVSRVNNIKH